jgi:hypothetical protein
MLIFFYLTRCVAWANDLEEYLKFKIIFRYSTLCLKFELYNFKLIYL